MLVLPAVFPFAIPFPQSAALCSAVQVQGISVRWDITSERSV